MLLCSDYKGTTHFAATQLLCCCERRTRNRQCGYYIHLEVFWSMCRTDRRLTL